MFFFFLQNSSVEVESVSSRITNFYRKNFVGFEHANCCFSNDLGRFLVSMKKEAENDEPRWRLLITSTHGTQQKLIPMTVLKEKASIVEVIRHVFDCSVEIFLLMSLDLWEELAKFFDETFNAESFLQLFNRLKDQSRGFICAEVKVGEKSTSQQPTSPRQKDHSIPVELPEINNSESFNGTQLFDEMIQECLQLPDSDGSKSDNEIYWNLSDHDSNTGSVWNSAIIDKLKSAEYLRRVVSDNSITRIVDELREPVESEMAVPAVEIRNSHGPPPPELSRPDSRQKSPTAMTTEGSKNSKVR